MLRRVPILKEGPESSNSGARLKPLGGEMKKPTYAQRVKEAQDEARARYNAELAEWDRLAELGKDLNWVKKADALMSKERGENEKP